MNYKKDLFMPFFYIWAFFKENSSFLFLISYFRIRNLSL
ncbi:hypothetical protein LSO10F_40068 [Candidatus Liberibacter solanacearum]